MELADSAASHGGYTAAFWTAFAQSASAMLLSNLDRVIVAANQASEPLFGRSPGSLVGMSWQAALRTLRSRYLVAAAERGRSEALGSA